MNEATSERARIVRVNFRLPRDVHADLARWAKAEGRPLSHLLREILEKRANAVLGEHDYVELPRMQLGPVDEAP